MQQVWSIFICSQLSHVCSCFFSPTPPPFFFISLKIFTKIKHGSTCSWLCCHHLKLFFSPVFIGLVSAWISCPCPVTDPKSTRFQVTFFCILIQILLKFRVSTLFLHRNFSLVEYLPRHEYFQSFLYCACRALSQLPTCNYSSPL